MCSSLQGIASLAPNIIHCVHFVHRRAVPVPLWWCLAQSLTSPTQRQTARAKGEIFSLLGRKGLKPFSLVHSSSVVCLLIWFPPQHQNIDLFHLFPRFCQKKGPDNFNSTASKLTVSFISNKKGHGEGAECTVACSDLTPTSPGSWPKLSNSKVAISVIS